MKHSRRGGARVGAGRPQGSGHYGHMATRTVRVPVSLIPKVRNLVAATVAPAQSTNLSDSWQHGADPVVMYRPLIESPRPQAGFPSPAADYVENTLDLNSLMVSNPPATFYVRSAGDSMIDAGILDSDILIVDRSLTPRSRSIVVAVYDGELFVKRLFKGRDRGELRSENTVKAAQYPPLEISDEHTCEIWGVVTGAVRKF